MSGDADDDSAILQPPSRAQACEGGAQLLHLQGRSCISLELWSSDEEIGSKVGFIGAHDIRKGVLYMKMLADGTDIHGEEKPTKSAITSLLDIADACRAKKLTIGLSVEHAGSVDFVCSLLYLGFQVVPSRKSPLADCALLLDLDIGWPSSNGWTSTDHTCTSDCSTSAEDDTLSNRVPYDSDSGGE